MDTPIYSDDQFIDKDDALQKYIIKLLSESTIKDINSRLTFVNHGIYIFSQYREKRYIINGFAEDLFWTMTSRLYVLLHDCGTRVIKCILQVIHNDGKQILKPFLVTSDTDIVLFDRANKFIDDIKILRNSEQHCMKLDSIVDEANERKCKIILKKICGNEIPKTQNEWGKCIHWILDNCNNMYVLLNERLLFAEKNATESQKQYLLGGYYSCLEEYYEGNQVMFNVICEIFRTRHKPFNKIYIQAIVSRDTHQIINKFMELIKSSPLRVDPYKVVLQAADFYIKI
ncbi:hypothetical protein [Clostridium sp. BNL1100]|uniref:hypothetical protein n=1 Tax=Clostridium sp. BNL1100 TaxID=755731 RepID=UPI00024A7B82|nr:hypothetical protein [Clostridium sp. BNL1100]AEY65740.1 hypothetical protein Clo1100_1509 [Clostridium sp. BNL1100]